MTLTKAMHCATLRDGSLWLVVPALSHILYEDGLRFWLSPLCLTVCCASYLHWDDHNMTGWRRIADIGLSTSYLVSEMATKPTFAIIDFLLRMVALLCILSCWEIPIGNKEGLTLHLLFRYLGWIAIMRSYIQPIGLAVLSAMYVATAYYSMQRTTDRATALS